VADFESHRAILKIAQLPALLSEPGVHFCAE
jgi:hypothetical protein